MDGHTRVVQVSSRVPNRLAESDFAGQEYAAPQGAAPYPSLLLAEKEEEERARAAEARARGGSSARGGPSPAGSRSATQPGARSAAPSPAGLPRVASGGSVRRSGSKDVRALHFAACSALCAALAEPDATHATLALLSTRQELQSGIAGVLGGLQPGYQSGAAVASSGGDLARSKQRGGSFGALPPRSVQR